MAYCTLDDLKKVLPEETLIQLTDDEGTGMLNESRITEAISQADGEIDSYIGGRYTVPLTSVHAVVRKWSCDMAVYKLYGRKVETMPTQRRVNYEDALRVMELVRDNKQPIPGLV